MVILYNLSDELSNLYGMREIQSNPEKSLIYMTTRFNKNLDESKNLFNAPLLKGGRVSPEEIVNLYNYSESRRFNALKEMYKNIEAARTLGVPEFIIRKKNKKTRY
jgi:plasmid replication initiation protein